MAKSGHDPAVTNRIKVGSPRSTKKRKGNPTSRTSRSGSGRKIR